MVQPKFHKLKVKAVRPETDDSVVVELDVPDDLIKDYNFTQGQHLSFKFTHKGEEIRRSYSICSAVNDEILRVGIKRVEGGTFSTYANEILKAGDELEVMTPQGRFHTKLDPAGEKNYLAFVAGSGITPVLSIIKSTLEVEPKSNFTLFYGNQNRKSIMFKSELEDLKDAYMNRFQLFHILSREPNEISLYEGRIDSEKCDKLSKVLFDPLTIDEFFLCGPEEMILSVKKSLLSNGVEEKKIHFELFTTPGIKSEERIKKSKVKSNIGKVSHVAVILDGLKMEFDLPYDGASILDASLEMGADLPFSCKGGVCCTCRAKLVEGQVDMDVNYSLEPEEIEAGFILCCQSHPITDKVVINFDLQS